MTVSRKRWFFFGALTTMAVAVAVALFIMPWSESCDAQSRQASAAWSEYVDHLFERGEERAQAARALEGAIARDPGEAMFEAERVAPTPGDEEAGVLYRDAMERLSLAEGACAP